MHVEYTIRALKKTEGRDKKIRRFVTKNTVCLIQKNMIVSMENLKQKFTVKNLEIIMSVTSFFLLSVFIR